MKRVIHLRERGSVLCGVRSRDWNGSPLGVLTFYASLARGAQDDRENVTFSLP